MTISRRTLAELERQLHRHAGLELPTWVVESRCALRMKELGLSAHAYLALVSSSAGASELGRLVEAVRVGETRFFRHAPHVDALLSVVVPDWRARGVSSPRIWSAGCASGEEPYTLALVLARELPAPSFSPTILATDVSADAVAAGRRGAYPRAALDHVPEEWRAGFTVHGSSVHLRPDVARMVSFEQHNLASASHPSDFDLIWCRNVLIYFGQAGQKRVIEHLVQALRPGGFLFLGYSETLRDAPGLTAVPWADQVLYQKVGGRKEAKRAGPKSKRSTELVSPASRPAAKPASQRTPAQPEHRPVRDAKPRLVKVSTVRVTRADSAGLSAQIGAALKAPGLASLTVDLDAAELIDDDVAPVLRRACAAAQAVGIEVRLRATRPGTMRWLRRHRLSGGDA